MATSRMAMASPVAAARSSHLTLFSGSAFRPRPRCKTKPISRMARAEPRSEARSSRPSTRPVSASLTPARASRIAAESMAALISPASKARSNHAKLSASSVALPAVSSSARPSSRIASSMAELGRTLQHGRGFVRRLRRADPAAKARLSRKKLLASRILHVPGALEPVTCAVLARRRSRRRSHRPWRCGSSPRPRRSASARRASAIASRPVRWSALMAIAVMARVLPAMAAAVSHSMLRRPEAASSESWRSASSVIASTSPMRAARTRSSIAARPFLRKPGGAAHEQLADISDDRRIAVEQRSLQQGLRRSPRLRLHVPRRPRPAQREESAAAPFPGARARARQ